MKNDRYKIGKVLFDNSVKRNYAAWDSVRDIECLITEYVRPSHNEKIIYDALFALKEYSILPQVYDYFECEGKAYVVIERKECVSLKERLATGWLKENELKDIFCPCMNVIEKLHSMGVYYQEIAPSEIMIDKNGKGFLILRGEILVYKDEERTIYDGYASYECYTGRKPSPSTDVYGIGAVMYRAVTGVVPPDIYARLEKDNITHIKDKRKDISSKLANAIMRAISVKPYKRYKSIDKLKKACGW